MGLVNRVLPDGELESYIALLLRDHRGERAAHVAAVKGIVAELSKPCAEIDRALCDDLVKRCFGSSD